MIGPVQNFSDEIDCGSFFDHIDDLLDFPVEDGVDAVLPSSDSFPSIWQSQPDTFVTDSVFSGNNSAADDLSAELSVPYEDIVHLEWLSTFCEDTFSGGSLAIKAEDSTIVDNGNNNKESLLGHKFQTCSPVSVLESSSSCSGEKTLPLSPNFTVATTGKRGRPRSKRPRPATFSPRPPVQLMISPSSSLTTETDLSVPAKIPSDSESFAESRLIIKIPKLVVCPEPKKKIKKMRFSLPRNPEDDGNQNAVRKCTHCEITKTPQWRAGPNGPKTLCNACGVRYKSGRLFPEYRPAASPTFVPALHSNSHRKVVEMRSKATVRGNMTMMSNLPDLIPNKSGIVGLDYMGRNGGIEQEIDERILA
ncbi:hypothetical protein ACFE04_003210 [Oxalis oulophora]